MGRALDPYQLIASILVSITPRAARLSMVSCDLVVYGLRLLTILLDQFSGEQVICPLATTMLGERIPQSLDAHPDPGSTVAGAGWGAAVRSPRSRLPLTIRRHAGADSQNV